MINKKNPSLKIFLTIVSTLSLLSLEGFAQNNSTTKHLNPEEKATKLKEYFPALENKLEALINSKSKKNDKGSSDLNLIPTEKGALSYKLIAPISDKGESENIVQGIECLSLRDFFKKQGVKVDKIKEENISSYLAAAKDNFSERLIKTLHLDYTKQVKKVTGIKGDSNKIEYHPAICFAELTDANNSVHSVYISPLERDSQGAIDVFEFGFTEEAHRRENKNSEMKIQKESKGNNGAQFQFLKKHQNQNEVSVTLEKV